MNIFSENIVMIDLPYFEDILYSYIKYVFNTLFPPMKMSYKKIIVYLSSLLHLIGTIMICFGIFFPKKYLIIYLIYLIFIAISYPIFKGHCFMTLLTNKYSGLTKYPLHIRLSTAKKALIINILITVIGILYPKYSLYSIFSKIFSD